MGVGIKRRQHPAPGTTTQGDRSLSSTVGKLDALERAEQKMRWVTLFDLAGVALGSCPRGHAGTWPGVGVGIRASTVPCSRPGRAGGSAPERRQSLRPAPRHKEIGHSLRPAVGSLLQERGPNKKGKP